MGVKIFERSKFPKLEIDERSNVEKPILGKSLKQ